MNIFGGSSYEGLDVQPPSRKAIKPLKGHGLYLWLGSFVCDFRCNLMLVWGHGWGGQNVKWMSVYLCLASVFYGFYTRNCPFMHFCIYMCHCSCCQSVKHKSVGSKLLIKSVRSFLCLSNGLNLLFEDTFEALETSRGSICSLYADEDSHNSSQKVFFKQKDPDLDRKVDLYEKHTC